MNQAARHILQLVAFVWLALGMGVPASAWTIHGAAHGAAKVSLDAHHHHDADGGISVHEHDEDETPDGGHDHMPSVMFSAVALHDTGFMLTVPVLVRASYAIASSHGIVRHPSHGLRRPPRLG